jgi:N-methylhydantoinase A
LRAIGIDIGGTFTDLVAWDPARHSFVHSKALTRYDSFFAGALDCLRAAGVKLNDVNMVRHGTTQVINAFVQRAGVCTALVTTRGFRDTLEIGRANRPIAFQLRYDRAAPLVPRPLRFEIGERMDAQGAVVEELNVGDLEEVARRIEKCAAEAVAVSFLNAYRNPAHEIEAATFLRRRLPGLFVTTGTELTREWFEYERTSTAVANAYVGPIVKRYLEGFRAGLADEGFSGRFYLMSSNGGLLTVNRAEEQPISLVESGPIGGCIAASAYAAALNLPGIIAFDMGGTTAKCALIRNGEFEVQSTYYIGGYEHGFPVRSPIIDIVEVGAGGGSIAAVDSLGRLTVGPRSAGSEPGPVAFGRGGTEPTVTDANLVMGRIGAGAFIGGNLQLDVAAARQALLTKVASPLGFDETALDYSAHGVLAIATTMMAGAINEITGDRGHDVRGFALVAFGGAGPLHACDLARALHIPLVIIPPEPGNFSALGMLLARPRIDASRTLLHELSPKVLSLISSILDELVAETETRLRREVATQDVVFERQLELRYVGQKHGIRIRAEGLTSDTDIRARFEDEYRLRFGHADAIHPVELVGVRVVALADSEAPDIRILSAATAAGPTQSSSREAYFASTGRVVVPVYRRSGLAAGFSGTGPAIIEEYGSTTVIGPADHFDIGGLGEIRIHCSGERV